MRTTCVTALRLAVVTAAAGLAIAACSSGSRDGTSDDGPLSSGSSAHGPIPRGSICAPGGRAWTFGDTVFTNYGSAAVTLDRVVLLHPRDQHLIGSYAVPGVVLLGTVHWPPNYKGIPPAWKHREPVHDFLLGHGRTVDMVLGLAAIRPGRATSQGMLVYYHDSSGNYVAKSLFANILSANTHTC